MSNTEFKSNVPRVVFMGMTGRFSPPSLLALLESGIDVRAVVLPTRARRDGSFPVARLEPPRTRSLPVLSSSLHTSIAPIAWEHAIPVWEVSSMSHPETHALYASLGPDAYCVACFSLYIPRSILDIPRLGCLNVHPSLLPENRGPDPLFWTFHQGSSQTGVTIHLMDEGLDTGPIVAQQRIDVPEGITYTQLEARCAELGGSLLARSLWDLYHGTASTTRQDESRSYYLPSPTQDDYKVQAAEWPAQRAYRFVKGAASREQPITLVSEGQIIQVADVISYSHLAIDTTTHKHETDQLQSTSETIQVRCKDGWIEVWRM